MTDPTDVTGTQDGGLPEPWTCKNCKIMYDASKEQSSLICSKCENTFDTGCLKINKTHYSTLKNRNDVLWLCPECLPGVTRKNISDLPEMAVKKMMESVNSIMETASKHVDQISQLDDRIKSLQTEIAKSKWLDEKIGELQGNVVDEIRNIRADLHTDVPKLWSEVVQSTPVNPPEITVDHLKKAFEKVAEHDKDKEVRSRGIVIYKLAESNRASSECRKKEDTEAISELLEFIDCSDAQIVYTDRLGQYNEDRIREGKYRPVKVRFTQAEVRDKVLKNLYKLRNAPEGIKKLSIRQDLNEEQRKELRAKTSETIEKTRSSVTTFYRVKGEPGNYRLVEFPKK
jgi:rubredoxin